MINKGKIPLLYYLNILYYTIMVIILYFKITSFTVLNNLSLLKDFS